MPLTDAKLRAAKPEAKPYKLTDAHGLHCVVTPAGGKLWRYKFRFAGKEKLLSLGDYPRISLVEARTLHRAAMAQLDQGIDPSVEKQVRKKAQAEAEAAEALTFEKVAREWFENRKHEWTPKYAVQVIGRLEADLFHHIGALGIAKIEPPVMLAALKKAEARGVLETTRRLKQYASSIFRFAIASGYCLYDPAAPLSGALKAPPQPNHHKAIPRSEVGGLMRKIATYDGEPETRIALHLALLTVVRTNELRRARWDEFEYLDDVEKALWRVPAERMKMREAHLVPLSVQAIAALRELKPMTHHTGRLFPGKGPDGVMSNNTMLFALYRLGYRGRTTTHGFRRLFSTEANEHGFNEDWIERQLAHDERNAVRAAYNAAQYLAQRRQMMAWWGQRLEELAAAE
jgi:integrase